MTQFFFTSSISIFFSISSSTSEATKTSHLPSTTNVPQLSCSSIDKRGVEWEGDPWEHVNKTCDEGIFTNETFSEGN